MTVQIYYLKRNFDMQKCERWFKERGIGIQYVDLKKHRLGKKEIELFIRCIGREKLFDSDSALYKERPEVYDPDPERLIEAAVDDNRILRLPVVRCGNKAACLYEPDVFASWL